MTHPKVQTVLSHQDVSQLAKGLAWRIVDHGYAGKKAYAIPRGGVPALYAIQATGLLMEVAATPAEADYFIDDIIDSGATMRHYYDVYPEKPFFALVDKTEGQYGEEWVVFPWESLSQSQDDTIVGTIQNRINQKGAPYFANDNIAEFIMPGEMKTLQTELASRAEHFLRGLVLDIERDHNTKGTAKRMAKMYLTEVFKGRYVPPPEITDFPNAKKLEDMYLTGPITIRSACSHHFVPIIGRCWIGIVPGERVIGLSKFNRIVEWIASRPQIQEELVMQIADFIEQKIAPKGLAVVIEATHMCMTWRGVREPMEAKMTTNVMRGAFRDKPELRAEFMHFVRK